MLNIKNTEIFSNLLAPLDQFKKPNPYSRACIEISDTEWLKMGIMRSLSDSRSGRGFLQNLFYQTQEFVGVGLFFESLKSNRRLNYIKHVLYELTQLMSKSRNVDLFGDIEELNKFHIYGGDGHYHNSATHDAKIEGKKFQTQHFYTVNMRTQAMTHLALAEIGNHRKKEHDTRALKRSTIENLRQSASVGEKVLYVWDRGGIDIPKWQEWKRKGIYFLSRSKKNIKFEVVEELEYDESDPVNNGIQSNQVVQTECGVKLRRVIYFCPFKKTTYSYITNLAKDIRPGVIAFLYKCRWDIEKVFDDFKNKMNESKSWASHDNAKTSQAVFLCISYNLALLLEDRLRREGVDNSKDSHRHNQRLKHDIQNSRIPEFKISSLIRKLQRSSQRPFALFRWIRSFMTSHAPWAYAVELLRRSYLKLA